MGWKSESIYLPAKEWHRFSIKLPESMVGPELYNFLQAIPLEVITEMKASGPRSSFE